MEGAALLSLSVHSIPSNRHLEIIRYVIGDGRCLEGSLTA